MKKRTWNSLFIFILGALIPAVLTGILTAASRNRNPVQRKPLLYPPDAVFPVVWTVLYLLMGTAAWMIYRTSSGRKRQALAIYVLQLTVNLLWPVFFFFLQLQLFSFFWLLLLLALVFLMMQQFFAISPAAAYLLLPYLFWLIFAGYLNLSIVLPRI